MPLIVTQTAEKPATAIVASAKPPGYSWLKKGSEADKAMKEAEFAAKAAKEAADRIHRFWLKAEETRQITFLDGALTADGGLDCIVLHEHTIQVGQKWDNFICVAEHENCPICDDGSKADTVAVFTVIDHTPYTVQSGPNAGKTVQDVKKLFVAKQQTFKQLKALGAKRGGLRGWTIEVSRMTDKDARVGSVFDFQTQQSDAALASWGDLGVPADYEKELRYMTRDELLANGIGKNSKGPGYGKTASVASNIDPALADQM